MNRLYYISFLLLLLFGASEDVLSQDLKASVSSNNVKVGQRIKVTFQYEGDGSSLQAPAFPGFRVLSGPNQSTSMQYVNGSFTQQVSFSFVLVAQKEGTFEIGSASIRDGGNTISSKPIKVVVGKGGGSPSASEGRNQQKKATNTGKSSNVFMQAKVNKRKVYQGEQIALVYTIYFKANIVANEVSKLPALNGFWTQDVDMPKQAQVYNANIDGMRYQAADLKKTVIFPQRSGTLEIDPMEFKCVVRTQVSGGNRRGFFGNFFGNYQDQEMIVKSKPIKIDVLPLPAAGRPVNFNGAVGSYSFNTKIDKDRLKANEAVTLIAKISGSGNLKLIDPPILDLPPDIDSYEPKTVDKVATKAKGVSGSKSFEYLLVPRHAGEYEIPSVVFSYFDTKKKQYVTHRSSAYKLFVEKGDEQATTAVSSIAKEDLKYIGSDILFIKKLPFEMKKIGNTFFLSAFFWCLYLLPLFLFVLFVVLRRKHRADSQNTVLMKHRRATRLARKRLKAASMYMKEGNRTHFFEETLKSLWGYVGDKLNVSVAELSKDSVRSSLEQKGLTAEDIAEFIDLLDKCEFARFAPSNQEGEMNEVYNNSVGVIEKMEGLIKS